MYVAIKLASYGEIKSFFIKILKFYRLDDTHFEILRDHSSRIDKWTKKDDRLVWVLHSRLKGKLVFSMRG